MKKQSTAFPQATAKNREIRLFFAGHCSGRLQLAMSLTHARCASGREIEGTSEEVRSCDLGGARRGSRSDVEDVVRRSSVSERYVRYARLEAVSVPVGGAQHSFISFVPRSRSHVLSSPNLINIINIIIIPTPESLPNH